MELKSGKFILRPWIPDDAESLAENANHEGVWRNLSGDFPHPYTLADARKWIEQCNAPDKNDTFFAIVVDGKAVGGIDFKIKSGTSRKTAILGYWLAERYWNKGIVSAAVALILKHTFDNFDVERMQAHVFEWNAASARVLEKNGFRYEGTLRKNTLKDGKLLNEKVYSILRQEVNITWS